MNVLRPGVTLSFLPRMCPPAFSLDICGKNWYVPLRMDLLRPARRHRSFPGSVQQRFELTFAAEYGKFVIDWTFCVQRDASYPLD
jgi:hypothetical protein